MKLSITNYTVQYTTSPKSLLQNFSLECPTSGLYLIYGANGAGKSTLFASIQGSQLSADVTGAITYGDRMFDLSQKEYRAYAQKYVGLVPQKYDEMLVPQYSVRENLGLALLPQFPSMIYSPLQSKIPQILLEIGVPLDTPVEQLSGGQRQITAIMMALQKCKKILLLDEPTATLDPANTALVMNFLVRLHHETGIVILMICHDLDLSSYTPYEPIVVK